MIEVIWDELLIRTLKKWKRKHPELISRLEDRLRLFVENPFNPLLKTHNLSGNLKEYRALSITYEYRLVFNFLSEDKALLIDIGNT